MNFPIWELHWAGGGLLIALIAVFHVYIAHFAVGGGLFLVLTEHLGYSRNSQPILDYTKRHTKFFLLVTMVLGGITGVGIWFIISLVAPAATITLIHTFVFAWPSNGSFSWARSWPCSSTSTLSEKWAAATTWPSAGSISSSDGCRCS